MTKYLPQVALVGAALLTAVFSLPLPVSADEGNSDKITKEEHQSIRLRYGNAYYFKLKSNDGRNWNYFDNFKVNFREGGDYNDGEDPTFQWSEELIEADYYVAPNTTMKIIQTNPNYYNIKKVPVTRRPNNLSINYITYSWVKSGDTWVKGYENHDVQPYAITWCGDGIRDEYVDFANGKQISEVCDPKDQQRRGWGTQGCNSTCEALN